MNATKRVQYDITTEREKQNDKWGQQNHPAEIWSLILGEEYGEAQEAILHNKFGGSHANTLREELVQLAAVAVQWIECIDRNKSEA